MILSFLLEGIISNYITIDILIIYYYFKEPRYFWLIGLLYDVIYTNTLFLHTLTFYLLSIIIKKITEKNYLYLFLVIVLYHTILYFISLITKVHLLQLMDIYLLFKNIIINSLIGYIVYFIHKRYETT